MIGNVLVGDFESRQESCIAMQRKWLTFIEQADLKAFPNVTVAPTARIGYQNMMMLSGECVFGVWRREREG